MPFNRHPSDVDYIRLFFSEEHEDIAVWLATLFLQHLGDSDHFIQPDDSIDELTGWGAKPSREIVSFLVALEDQEVFPKEALSHVETFRELVEYVAERSPHLARSASQRPGLLLAHNSFTNL